MRVITKLKYEIMKKLFIIGSALIAFTAVNYIASNNTGVYANSVASTDTVPKKDTAKKKDSIAFQSNENTAFLASMDTVPKKDTSKKKDSLFLAMR